MGNGAKLTSAYTARMFVLAAVMYVDDTDLTHRASTQDTGDEVLFQQVQQATTDWGMLAQATGGALKQEKCYYYAMCYKWVKGRAKLKSLSQLPKQEMLIPQPDGSTKPIPLKRVREEMETLGVFYAPEGDSTTHIRAMKQKGFDWLDRLRTNPLHPRDGWLSFYLQLHPGMVWGLVTVIMKPLKLET